MLIIKSNNKAYETRLILAKAQLRAGYTESEIRKMHGIIILREAKLLVNSEGSMLDRLKYA
jgi:hypothetical protein